AQAALVTGHGAAASAGAERQREIAPSRPQSRHNSEEQTREDGYQQRKSQNIAVDRHPIQTREISGGQESQGGARQQRAEKRAGQSTRQRDHHALRQHLAKNRRARSTQR